MSGIDRRDFLRLTATGLVVLFDVDPVDAAQPSRRQGYPEDFNSYLHVGADGVVTCFVGKIEMGQGTITSLAQLLAEELDVPFESIRMVMGDTDRCPWDMGTFGSLSIRQFGPVLRQAGAEGRAALLQLAAERLQVPVDRLAVKDGVVRDTAGIRSDVTYANLVGGRRIERTLAAKPAPKPFRLFNVMGRSVPRPDVLEKVTGQARYAGDIVQAGGARHARILRPPSHGATLASVDTSEAERIPGVTVVREGDLIAVLHEHWDEADRALALVRAEWTRTELPYDDTSIFDHLVKAAPAPQTVAEGGTLAEGEALVTGVVEGTYFDSYFAHAPMEPHAAVAAVENGKVTVWAGTQTPFPLKSQIARALRIPEDKVRVITPYVGGGFGGKSASQQGVEAARLAMVTATPVRVQWSRQEEFFFDTFRPAAVVTVRSGIDATGRLRLWDYLVYCAGDRGAAHFYDIAHHRTVSRGGWGGAGTPGLHPFAVGPWRAPGASTNAFARESQIDVMAAAARKDPYDFRVKNMADPRMLRVASAVANRFGWKPAPAPSGRGVGMACGTDAGTYVALMVQADVDKTSGAVHVRRMVLAQDMGLVVNPDGALQQIEGCLTMGLGYALSEEVRFRGGSIATRNFDSYELPRFSTLPRLDAVILNDMDSPSQGGGEPAIVPVGAAVANAIFDATGVRLHRMPMTPARVKAALART